MTMHKTDERRFWDKVAKSKEGDGCWIWTAGTDKDGYGLFWYKNKNIRAHRFALTLSNINYSEKFFILHKCDNAKCVNPAHLFIGTQADNMKDKVYKNRTACTKGENNGNSKLTEEVVKEILKALPNTSYSTLSAKYNISIQTLSCIATGKRWKHLTY